MSERSKLIGSRTALDIITTFAVLARDANSSLVGVPPSSRSIRTNKANARLALSKITPAQLH
ncbi:hypothetical protein [Nonomuraea jabiensis]|uniref:hypothetical protein n=1 Tax=Nonomuraea jabiensis TaxID=882448 RepID=UPI003D711F21